MNSLQIFAAEGKLHLLPSIIFRLNCYDSCNKAYFPSLFCSQIDDIKIELNGNVFDKFYKYPNPEYVMANEVEVATYDEKMQKQMQAVVDMSNPKRPKYTSKMDLISEETRSIYSEEYQTCAAFVDENLEYPNVREETGRQQRLHTCFNNCKDYIDTDDDYKRMFTFDNRPNCTSDLLATDERYLICLYNDDVCEKTVHPEELGWGNIKVSITKGAMAVVFSTPV
jgi:hypothetical protein